LNKKFPAFTEFKSSSLQSQKLASGFCPDSEASFVSIVMKLQIPQKQGFPGQLLKEDLVP
jgi:hypothetical protein